MLPNSPLVAPGTPSSRSNRAVQHRLLYRGALSLPDSYLLLDGLSFVAETRHDVCESPSANLLSNPLALALESMRGRPNLHLLGTERLEDVWLDTKSNVTVYIHPYSTLSQLYFQNTFCLDPIKSLEKRTNVGVRVSLSDSNDPQPSDFLIYGELVLATDRSAVPVPSTSTSEPMTLQMFASRILSGPPPPVARVPRPDDPTPRKPPPHLLNAGYKRKRDASSVSLDFGDGIKRTKSGRIPKEEDENVKMAREIMLRGPPAAQASRLSRGKSSADVFKVPALPVRSESINSIDADVFGSVGSISSKSKGSTVSDEAASTELEKANKTVIKQAAVACLARHGVNKPDGDFHELYQTIYRGVTFALRNIIRTQAVNIRVVEKLTESHARLYVNGNGDNHMPVSHAKK